MKADESGFDNEPLDKLISDAEDGRERRHSLWISFVTNWTFQTLCQYQGILALHKCGSHFNLFIQRARDLEHAAIKCAQPKPKGEVRKGSLMPYGCQLYTPASLTLAHCWDCSARNRKSEKDEKVLKDGEAAVSPVVENDQSFFFGSSL